MNIYKRRDGREFVIVTIMLEKELYEEIVNRLGRTHGILSFIINNAVRSYLESGGLLGSGGRRAARTIADKPGHVNPDHRRASIGEVFDLVKKKLAELMGVPVVVQVPEKYLDMAIMQLRGTDRRTVEKWKRIFEDFGLIRVIGGVKPNRVFEIVDGRDNGQA